MREVGSHESRGQSTLVTPRLDALHTSEARKTRGDQGEPSNLIDVIFMTNASQ